MAGGAGDDDDEEGGEEDDKHKVPDCLKVVSNILSDLDTDISDRSAIFFVIEL